MKLPQSAVANYRDAAKPFRNKPPYGGHYGSVGPCLELVGELTKKDVPELEGLVLPQTGRQPRALLGILATGSELRVLLPVCPPGPRNPRDFKPGITPEARAGIRAARVLAGEFADRISMDVKPTLLVANTETDLEPVMERAGGIERYLRICEESADLIRKELGGHQVNMLNRFFPSGASFADKQYQAEDELRAKMEDNPKLRALIERLSHERAAKHQQILGRTEDDNELSVRYAAQYMALGNYGRSMASTAICNYPSPNIQFYNSMAPSDRTVPVFESRLERRSDDEG